MARSKFKKRQQYLAKIRMRRMKAKKLEALLLGEDIVDVEKSEPRMYHSHGKQSSVQEDLGRTGLVKQGKPKWERTMSVRL